MRYLPDDNLSYPVLIRLNNGSSGSGFFLRKEDAIYLVTAKHVLFDGKNKKHGEPHSLHDKEGITICYAKDLKVKDPISLKINFDALNARGGIKTHEKADVTIIKVANLKEVGKNLFELGLEKDITISGPAGSTIVGIPPKNFKAFEDVLISNEVIVFGYPNSLGNADQIDYNKPLLRKGIVAGKNEKNGTIIIDCPVYYGNSGGLVVEIEQHPNGTRAIHCIGVISQYVPFVEKLLSLQHQTINTNIENSGYAVVVPIDTINDLIA